MVKIIIGGDICSTKRDEKVFESGDSNRLFNDVLPEIQSADLVIANLETPLITSNTPINKSGAVFGNSPKILKAIKHSGISFLNLANNHILDHGEKGLQSTLKSLKEFDLQNSGAGIDLQLASQPFTTSIKGKVITILSYAENEFSIAKEDKPGANPVDIIDFVSRIKKLKEDADYIILLYHGGKENYHLPTPKQQKLCRFYIEQGVDLVVCQHSHTAGVYEEYKNGNIYYGQGNFIFDPYPLKKDWLYKGYLIQIELNNNNSVEIKLIPFIHNSFYKDEIGIRKMGIDEALPFLNYIKEESQKMICDPSFVYEEWGKLSMSLENTYLSILNGNGKLLRKLNEKTSWLKYIYKNKRRLVLKNIVTCETHREIVETILKEK